MKFLHTADWHLGVKTNGRDRLAEQKNVLEEILSIANFEGVDVIIVAGDVFNTSSPSAEAEELFFEMIEKFSANGERFVLVLAGNHDDPTRLTAGLPLATKRNIAIVGDVGKIKESAFNRNALVSVVETGKGYIKIQKNEECACIAYLPYPSDARISEKLDGELSLTEKVRQWAELGASAFEERTLNIFVSHLFLVGAKCSDKEIKVGDILAVEKSALPSADYTALGHLHTPQNLGHNIYYSGAITELTPKQKGLGVNIFESEGGKLLSVKSVKLQNTARYERVEATSIEEAEAKLEAFDDGDLVELELIQQTPLSASSLKQLRKNFACISNITLTMPGKLMDGSSVKGRKTLSDVELFKQFYFETKGVEPSDDLIKLFTICKGEEDETD